MEDSGRDPPDRQWGRLRPCGEDGVQVVDDIFLPHEDGDKDVGDDTVSYLSCVRLMCDSEGKENRHVGREGDAEKSPVYREQQIAQVTNRLGILLLYVLLFQVSFPVETLLLGSRIIVGWIPRCC